VSAPGFFFAFVYDVLGVPRAAGILYPVLDLLLNPMVASAAVTFRSVSVIAQRTPPRTRCPVSESGSRPQAVHVALRLPARREAASRPRRRRMP
jgi:hypothetical protein